MADLNAILKNKMGLSVEQAKKKQDSCFSFRILPAEYEINSLFPAGSKH